MTDVTDRKRISDDELAELYMTATGTGNPTGAQTWAAETVDVSARTIRNWLAGKTRPTVRQIGRLRFEARRARARRRLRRQRREAVRPEEDGGPTWRERVKAFLASLAGEQFQERRREEAERKRRLHNANFRRWHGRLPVGETGGAPRWMDRGNREARAKREGSWF